MPTTLSSMSTVGMAITHALVCSRALKEWFHSPVVMANRGVKSTTIVQEMVMMLSFSPSLVATRTTGPGSLRVKALLSAVDLMDAPAQSSSCCSSCPPPIGFSDAFGCGRSGLCPLTSLLMAGGKCKTDCRLRHQVGSDQYWYPSLIFVYAISTPVAKSAAAKMTSPEFLPLTIFSRIAEASEAAIRKTAVARNAVLCVWIHRPIPTVPRPKLARMSVTCQQNAKTVAETTAAILLMNLNMVPFIR